MTHYGDPDAMWVTRSLLEERLHCLHSLGECHTKVDLIQSPKGEKYENLAMKLVGLANCSTVKFIENLCKFCEVFVDEFTYKDTVEIAFVKKAQLCASMLNSDKSVAYEDMDKS